MQFGSWQAQDGAGISHQRETHHLVGQLACERRVATDRRQTARASALACTKSRFAARFYFNPRSFVRTAFILAASFALNPSTTD